MIGDIITAILLVVGGGFGLIGSYGLVKLPDAMTRLHAPTKSATLGVGAVLLASMVWFPGRTGQVTWHELLITLFLLLTAPISGYMLAKANMLRLRRDLPPPAPDQGQTGDWATFQAQEKAQP